MERGALARCRHAAEPRHNAAGGGGSYAAGMPPPSTLIVHTHCSQEQANTLIEFAEMITGGEEAASQMLDQLAVQVSSGAGVAVCAAVLSLAFFVLTS